MMKSIPFVFFSESRMKHALRQVSFGLKVGLRDAPD